MNKPSEIWKYTLDPSTPAVSIPEGATVLSADSQHEAICIWVAVDPSAPKVEREFVAVGTGHPMPWGDWRKEAVFIGSVKLGGGTLIFHVFENRRPQA